MNQNSFLNQGPNQDHLNTIQSNKSFHFSRIKSNLRDLVEHLGIQSNATDESKSEILER